jgi:pimeloyl-ACP methyl ester carboxylesterase
MWCAGSGSPTVVLESALGQDTANWFKIGPQVAAQTRLCAYTRAGIGGSEPAGASPRTSSDVAADLHTLLHTAGIQPPYVLVGHSVGGWHTQVFTSAYREEVAGLVLVDSLHPDQAQRQLEALPPEALDEPEGLRKFRLNLSAFMETPALNTENLNLAASAEQVRAAGSLGDLPLAVVTANQSNAPDLPEEVAAALHAVWLELQDELASLSSNSRHTFATEGGHFVQLDQPEVVIEAIVYVLEAAREP